MPNCRSCDAPILWAKTERGKSMPLDLRPSGDGNMYLNRAGVCRPRRIDDDESRVYMPHWKTCPQADSWRRK